MNEIEPWSLSKFDLAAKLQACEIELRYTKEELERSKQEICETNNVIVKRDQQIKAQSRRQGQIENIHKELIHEYEQHVACLKQEVSEVKESHDKLLAKYKEVLQKQSPKFREGTTGSNLLSARLLEATNNLEKLLRNSPSSLYGQSNTLEILQKIMNGHCVYLCDEMLKRPLSMSKIRLLEENVLQFSWIVNETQERLQEMAKELKMLIYTANNELSVITTKNGRDDCAPTRNNTSNLDWTKLFDSKLAVENVMKAETEEMHDLENRIKSYAYVLENLLNQKSRKQVISNALVPKMNGIL